MQTAEGLPIYHEVFDGDDAEVSTLKTTLETVMQRFEIRRVIAVAYRGLLSMDNLDELKAMKTPSGEPLDLILALSILTEGLAIHWKISSNDSTTETMGLWSSYGGLSPH